VQLSRLPLKSGGGHDRPRLVRLRVLLQGAAGMNDRELLEMAAKTAKIHIVGFSLSAFGVMAERADGGWWDPLDDDGDAFRLALELEMPIHPARVWKSYRADVPGGFLEASRDVTPLSDPSATRRAIVEVAAEVGKATA